MPSKSRRPVKRGASLSDLPMPAAIGTSKPSAQDRARERRYEAEHALETLSRAEEHKRNPRLMSDVKKLAAEHVEKMKKFTGG